jgi:hypothetical protein
LACPCENALAPTADSWHFLSIIVTDVSPQPTPSLARHLPFALFWASRALSVIAFNILAVAVGWQLYALTASAFDLGLVGLAQFLPRWR